MKREMLLGAVAGAFILTAGQPALAQKDRVGSIDRMFIKSVAQGNMAEVRTGRLALERSKDEKVRHIAQMLVKEHGQAQSDLAGTAKVVKVNLPRDVNPMQKRMYRRLSSLSGTEFDRAFMKGQVKAHYDTIAIFKKEMEDGQSSIVRNYASKYQPGIENHTKMITGTANRFGIPVAADGSGSAMNTGTAASAVKPAGMGNMKMNHGSGKGM